MKWCSRQKQTEVEIKVSPSSKEKNNTVNSEKNIDSVSISGVRTRKLVIFFVLFVIFIGVILYFVWPLLSDYSAQTLTSSSVTPPSQIVNKHKITENPINPETDLLRFDKNDGVQGPVQMQQPRSGSSVTLLALFEQIKRLEQSLELANSKRLDNTDLMQIESNVKRVDALEAQLTKMYPVATDIYKNNEFENVPSYGGRHYVNAGRIDELEDRFSQLIAKDEDKTNRELDKITQKYKLVAEKLRVLEQAIVSREKALIHQNEAIFLTIELSKLARKASTALPFSKELKIVKSINPFKDVPNHEFNKAIDTIEIYSKNGVATISDLSASFNNMAHKVIKSDALAEDQGWVDATIGKLRQIITVRRVGGDINPESIEGRLGEARVALSAGNLMLVTKILDVIPDNARRGAEGWLVQIKARMQTDAALEVLEQEALKLIKLTRSSRIVKEHD